MNTLIRKGAMSEERKLRKHHSQMSLHEVLSVVALVSNHIKDIKTAPHALERSKKRVITPNEAYDAIQNGRLIEVNDSNGNIRALFRSELGICVVLSLSTWDIVTAYYNSPNDEHPTLDKSWYTWKVDLGELIGKLADGRSRV